MNELKLSLRNFQSISEGELIFKTGLNFIIGQSNSGKSATFRALKACLLNPKGSQRFIKKGNNKSIVTLFYNGNEIEWDRTNKESSYIINGEQYIKTGTSDTFKILMNDTGFVKDEKEGALMNIEEELQLPFPFGVSKADLFKLFENVFCVSDSAVILKAAKEQEDNIKDNIEALELDKIKVQNKLSHLQDFKSFLEIDKLESYKDFLINVESRIINLKEGLSTIKLAVKLNNTKLEVGEREFNDLFSPYLEALELKKVLIQTRKIHKLSKDLQELDLNRKFEDKLEYYRNLKSLNRTLQKLKKLNKLKVNELSFSSKLEEFNELRSLYLYVQDLQRKIKDLQIDKKREEERIESIEAKLKEFKVCPLCHHSLEN